MAYRCLGCDTPIGWDGKGMFSYTCPCGSRVFYNEETQALAMPSSILIALDKKTPITAHLDFIVGTSPMSYLMKDAVIAVLKAQGAIWMKDCEKCLKDGTYQKELDRQTRLALDEADEIVRHASGK